MTSTSLPLLIEPLELQNIIATDATAHRVCIVDLSSEQSFAAGHIPGAVYVPPRALMSGSPPAPGKLPPHDRLEQLFGRLGHTKETHYIVYDDEGGGWAGRFIWILDVINHKKYSYVNGGLQAWKGDGLDVSQETINPEPTQPIIEINPEPTASKEHIINNLENTSLTIWDARSPDEYQGNKVLAAKGGHIPGAINCEWTNLMDFERHFRLREDAKQYLSTLGINGDKKIVTHCQSHHRSGFTYLVGRILGFDIQAYAGSWSEWGNDPNTPTEVKKP